MGLELDSDSSQEAGIDVDNEAFDAITLLPGGDANVLAAASVFEFVTMFGVDCIEGGNVKGCGGNSGVKNVCSLSHTAGSKNVLASSMLGNSSPEFGVTGILDISPLVEDKVSSPPILTG